MLGMNRGGKKIEKRGKKEGGGGVEVGSRDQSIPWMKSKRQSVRHKHECHPQELASAWWLIRVLLSLFLRKWEIDGGRE